MPLHPQGKESESNTPCNHCSLLLGVVNYSVWLLPGVCARMCIVQEPVHCSRNQCLKKVLAMAAAAPSCCTRIRSAQQC